MGYQAEANAYVPLPTRDGVSPSFLWLQPGPWTDMLSFLAEYFPMVDASIWAERLERGEVVDGKGVPLRADSPYRKGTRIWYYREMRLETPIPFEAKILHRDEHLLVVDKPHFLPMTPGGRFLHETLLVRLKKQLGMPQISPIHRLDRETAGVVILSLNPASRSPYQELFRHRQVEKTYEALAPLMARAFPFTHRSRMEEGDKFFTMREVEGPPNSETVIDLISAQDGIGHYRLHPHTGRMHQLRVHMAALGAPILNDAFYPVTLACKGDDFSAPLQLLARSISFTDPLSGQARRFDSLRQLGANERDDV